MEVKSTQVTNSQIVEYTFNDGEASDATGFQSNKILINNISRLSTAWERILLTARIFRAQATEVAVANSPIGPVLQGQLEHEVGAGVGNEGTGQQEWSLIS